MNLNEPRTDTDLKKNYSKRDDKTTNQSENGFDNLGITPNLIKEIKRLKFKNPTPIQKEAIPTGIEGKDIIALAQTGSGKTLAFGIPMLQRLSKIKNATGLILVPTRELALQVDESIKSISRYINIRTAVIIGGAPMTRQRVELKKNPRIIIATPGRLMDHIDRRTIKLNELEIFVLDEADRMLDMGFIPDIKKIMKAIPPKHQTMLFSATMPKQIEAIAEKLMEDPIRFEIDRSGATPAEVSQELFLIKHQLKLRLLGLKLKDCSGPVLVFTRTKRTAGRLTGKVKNMGYAAAEIHSDRSLAQRRRALEGFKKGSYQILIATDIAARGIDVKGIEMVVNFDMPANAEDYVHRIGRTARAGNSGLAVSFVTNDQIGDIRALERFMKINLRLSDLPALPSEKVLFQEGFDQQLKNEISMNDVPSERKSSSRPSRRRGGKPKNSQRTDAKPNDSDNERSSWSNFKKKDWPSKKKSVGQGSKRRRRPKNK